jgi:hypothetical protein
MSLRYTGEATMDEPALRDVERWKDKIEVRLDNRQVFFLFFGSAMVACMLFVLGVIVGKRLESRGRAEAPVIEDPLAALDRFSAPASAAPAGSALAFPRALINNAPARTGFGAGQDRLAAKSTLTTTLPAPPKRASLPAETPAVTREAPAKRLALVESPAAPAKKPALAESPPAPALARKAPPSEAPAASTATAKKTALLPHPVTGANLVAAKTGPAAPKAAALAAKPTAPGPTKATGTVTGTAAAATTAAKTPAAPAHAPGKGNFLLQLSSFQDRAEADAFARRFAGQNAYVVASEVPGKGLWYRVRVGSYGTMKDATAAKTAFEHEHGVIAYVAGTGPSQ